MKNFLAVGILLVCSSSALASTIVCDVVESVGPMKNGSYALQSKYPVSADLKDGADYPLISVDSKYVKNVHIDIYACVSCATSGNQRFDESNVKFTDTVTGQSTTAFTMGDWIISSYSVSPQNTVSVNCSVGK